MSTEGQSPICYIIAGPNGAGKTTFARTFLPEFADSDLFINADLIASGLSPLNPENENVLAARLMLEQIEKYTTAGKSFAFESTLSGKVYIERLQKLKAAGYTVGIYYIMLTDIEISLKRIEERVLKGGHNISEVDVRRRFSRSMFNFLSVYSHLADNWAVYDNSVKEIRGVAAKTFDGIQVFDEALFSILKENAQR